MSQGVLDSLILYYSKSCVWFTGYQYALMSVKTALASILRQYKVVGDIEDGPIPKIRMKLDIMMKAVDGYDIALERRRDHIVHAAYG